MKIVLNRCYGGFRVNETWLEATGRKGPVDTESMRFDKLLIESIEDGTYKDNPEDPTLLEVVEFPEDATDWMINEYDGIEWVVYVKDGKLHKAV